MLLFTFFWSFCYLGASRSQSVRPDYGLCSQVYQMHEYCTGVRHFSSTTSKPSIPSKRGKAGPRGPPGIVNYEIIERQIAEKFSELQATNNAKLAKFEAKIEHLENIVRSATLNTDCQEVQQQNARIWNGAGGVFDIFLSGNKVGVYCDLQTEGKKWSVFQRRMDGSVDFYRNWTDYVHGFGDASGEFWLGLETLHQLTTRTKHELRIDMEDWEGNRRFAKYSTFRVGDSGSAYQLTIGGYSGNSGDAMISISSGMRFSTKNRDNDERENENCAVTFKGAWWYKSCHHANLNGFYFSGGNHESYADGVNWNTWRGLYYSVKFTEMKIRPIG